MHEYRQLVEREMAARWGTDRGAQSSLARASGLSRQVINTIVKDERDRLIQVPEEKTVDGLAGAFNLKPEVIWSAVAAALGLPSYVVPPITHEVKDAHNATLLKELGRRLNLEVTIRSEGDTDEGEKTIEHPIVEVDLVTMEEIASDPTKPRQDQSGGS